MVSAVLVRGLEAAPGTRPVPVLADLVASLVRERGPGLLDDRRRLLGLLRDKRPAEGRAIRVLMTAFDQGVGGRFRGATVSEIDIGREVALLCGEAGLDRAQAREAVETLAMAVAGYRSADLRHSAPQTWGEPAAPRATGGRPSVERLTPAPVSAAGAPAPGSRRGHGRAWFAAVATVFVLGAGVGTMRGDRGAGAPDGAPHPPAPEEPRPVSGPTARAAPVLTLAEPYAPLPTERVSGAAGTMAVYFALPIDGRPVTYHAAFGFDAGRTHGQGIVTAFAGDRAVSTGVVGADRVTAAGTDRSYLRVAGPLRGDAPGVPGVCVYAQVTPDLGRVDLVPSGLFAVFALKDGACDNGGPLGYGRLR